MVLQEARLQPNHQLKHVYTMAKKNAKRILQVHFLSLSSSFTLPLFLCLFSSFVWMLKFHW